LCRWARRQRRTSFKTRAPRFPFRQNSTLAAVERELRAILQADEDLFSADPEAFNYSTNEKPEMAKTKDGFFDETVLDRFEDILRRTPEPFRPQTTQVVDIMYTVLQWGIAYDVTFAGADLVAAARLILEQPKAH
jgi:hypothetical protein